MLLVFFAWRRSASASHSVAPCQQNVNRRVVIKERGGEMEMWRGAISSQITSVCPCCSDREGGRRREEERKSKERETEENMKKETALLPSFPPSQPLTPLTEFSQVGKFSADDTVVKMKTPQRSVDVTVIDS